jgi:hypothetical protein
MFRPWRVKPEMTQKSLTITESAATWIAVMISGSAATRFSSTISISIVGRVHWWFLCQQQTRFRYWIVLSAANQFFMLNCGADSESLFAAELWCQQWSVSLLNYGISSEIVLTVKLLCHKRTSFTDDSVFQQTSFADNLCHQQTSFTDDSVFQRISSLANLCH